MLTMVRTRLSIVLAGLALLLASFLGYAQANTTTTLTADVNPSIFGEDVTFTATVTVAGGSGSEVPSGTVTFYDYDGTVTLGTGTLSVTAPYEATFVTSSLIVGDFHKITAAYGGDADTNPSMSGVLMQTVNRADTSVSFSSVAPEPSMGGAVYTVSGAVTVDSPGSGTPTGIVTVADGEGQSCTSAVSEVDGTWNCALTALDTGARTLTLTATYGGDVNFANSSGTTTHDVSETPPADTGTTLVSDNNPSDYGELVTFTATITPTPSGGMVAFKDTGETIGSAAVDPADGTAVFATDSLSVGTHPMTAVYSGNEDFAGSTSSPLNQVVQKIGTETELTSDLSTAAYHQPVTFTALVTTAGGGNPVPTGTITFKDGTVEIGTGAVGGSGEAFFTTSNLAIGSHSATAVYTCDGPYDTSTSAAESVTIEKRDTETRVEGSDTPLIINDTATFIVTVTDVSPGTPSVPTGNVTVSVSPSGQGSLSPTSPSLGGDGRATFTYTPSSAETTPHVFTATYNGDATHVASDEMSPRTEGTFDQSIHTRALDITLTCSLLDAYINEPVHCTVILSDDTTAGSPVVPDETYFNLSDDRHSDPTRFSAISWTSVGGDRVGTFTYTPAAWDTDADQEGSWTAQPEATATITASFAGSPVHTDAQAIQPLTVRLRPTQTTVKFSPDSIYVWEGAYLTVTVEDTAGTAAGSVNPTGSIAISDIDTQVDPAGGVRDITGPTTGTDGWYKSLWTYSYGWVQLYADGTDYDTVTATYTPNDGVHDWSDGQGGMAITRRPTRVTVVCNGDAETGSGFSLTATVEEYLEPSPYTVPGVQQLIVGTLGVVDERLANGSYTYDTAHLDSPGYIAVNGVAPSWTFDFHTPGPIASPTVSYVPSDYVHMESPGAPDDPCTKEIDTSIGGDDSTGSGCTAGCGSGGVDVFTMQETMNEMILGFHILQMGLDVASIVTSLIPDPVWTAGIVFESGTTIPAKEIVAAIFDTFNNVLIEAAITAMESDLDGDGLYDVIEQNVTKTSSILVDTDADAMSDDEEVGYSAGFAGGNLRPDPNNPDSDADGLMDGYELAPFATNVCVDDTDCDSVPDGVEVACATEPTADNGFDETTFAALGYSFAFPFDDLRDHPDPREGDTDGDGLDDSIELGPGSLASSRADDTYHSYVNDADSDDDGLQDGWEDTNGNGEWDGGTSSDGTPGFATMGTNIETGETHLCLADTDGDGLTDGEEEGLFGHGARTVHSMTLGTTTIPALDEDSDDDGLSDYEEQVVTQTDPLNWDSDGDTIGDADELKATGGSWPARTFVQVSDPLDPDTDDDRLRDDIEYDGTGLSDLWPGLGGSDDVECPFVNDDDSDDDGLQDGTESWDGNGSITTGTIGNSQLQADTSPTTGETDFCLPDTDHDGLTDGEEVALLGGLPVSWTTGFTTVIPKGVSTVFGVEGAPLDPTVPALDDDSDNDGLSDYEEVTITHTDPLDQDSDNDTLSDANELIATGGAWPRRSFQQESDPLDPDTDDDELPDYIEYPNPGSGLGTSRTAPGGTPDNICPYVNDDDSDDDGLQDGIEDSDRDGEWDSLEPAHSAEQNPTGETNLCDPDTDDDGLTDGEEVALFGGLPIVGTFPYYLKAVSTTAGATIPALDDDSDNDGLSDYEEVNITRTDPLDADTDDDNISDANELIATSQGSTPIGFPIRTFIQESDPLDPDTDDDYLQDDMEYKGTAFEGTGLGILRTVGGTPDNICPYVNDDDSDDDGLQDGVEDANKDGTYGLNGGGMNIGGIGSHPGYPDKNGAPYWETNLCDPDTDGDGLLDGEEVGLLGGEPLFGRPGPGETFSTVLFEEKSTVLPVGSGPGGLGPYSFSPVSGSRVSATVPVLDIDSDDDGLSDYEEAVVTATDPLDQDSDNDTLMDADELIATGGVAGAVPRRSFDQESDPLDINTDDDGLFDPIEGSCGSRVYLGTGLSGLAGALGGSRDVLCPYVNDDDSDNDGIQDGRVILIDPAVTVTGTGSPPLGYDYRYTHYEDFVDIEPSSLPFPGQASANVGNFDGEQRDAEDSAFSCNVCDPDSDGDGLNDGEEIAIGTNPDDCDTDDDGRNDWHEVTGGGPIPTDPFDPDTDDDGLLDSAEVFGSNSTNPVNGDTDGDGLCDGGAGTPWMTSGDARVIVNPICKSCSTPGLIDCGTASTRTGSPDGIGDHPNRFGFGEDQNGNGAWDSGETDPNQYDTDGDAVADGIERLSFSTSRQYMIPPQDVFGRPILVTYPEANNVQNPCGCLDPLNPDSDDDGLSDGYEDVNHDGNFDFLPSDFDIFTQSIQTSLPDPEETNPCVADSDGDGLTDWEERNQRQPLLVHPPLPLDNDGDGVIDEDPADGIDNDLDGRVDEDPAEGPIELTFNPTNPLDHDTDNDWLLDGVEVYWECVAIEYTTLDNDSDGFIDEDPVDGLDNDGDGLFDEDPVDFWVRFIPMLDPTNRDSDSDGYIDGLDEDPCNSEMIPLLEPVELEPVDSDGDGFSDDDEIAAGTHPNSPDDHPTAYYAVDVDFDESIDDRIWLEPGACCGEASAVVVDLDNNVLIDLRIAITSRSVKRGDFDGDGREDDIRYTVEYILSNYRTAMLRGIATIDDFNCDFVIDWVIVERK